MISRWKPRLPRRKQLLSIEALLKKGLKVSPKFPASSVHLTHGNLVDKHQNLLRWLDLVETAAALLDFSELHQPGTGHWLIESSAFVEWFNTTSSAIWLNAKRKKYLNVLFKPRILTSNSWSW